MLPCGAEELSRSAAGQGGNHENLVSPKKEQRAIIAAAFSSCAFAALVLVTPRPAREIKWLHLSSRNGDLPNPGGSNEQTGLLVANLDKSTASGFVISYRVKGPALVWFMKSTMVPVCCLSATPARTRNRRVGAGADERPL
jgi:hypothetical protein